jgi:hypothetical protein
VLHETAFKLHLVLTLVTFTNEETMETVLMFFMNSAMEIPEQEFKRFGSCLQNELDRQTISSLSTLVAERSGHSIYLLKDIQHI